MMPGTTARRAEGEDVVGPVQDAPADVEELRELGSALREAGYTAASIGEVLGADAGEAADEVRRPVLLRRTSGGSALETLIRLFLLDATVDLTDVAAALGPIPLERWIEVGLLARDVSRVTSRYTIRPYDDLLVVGDRIAGRGEQHAADRVVSYSASTLSVARLMIALPGGAVLDLGVGAGLLSVLAYRDGAASVVGTDVNRRALVIAALTAGLNGYGIELLEGSLFEPVERRRFDLIVSNPPFVIGPADEFVFMTSSVPGGICQRIVSEASLHLSAGGFCQFLTNWAVPPNGDAAEHIRMWFQGAGCDAWVQRFEVRAVEDYAENWIAQAHGAAAVPDLLDSWMAYYERHDVGTVHSAMVTMRPAEGTRPWFRLDEMPHLHGRCGEDVRRGFEARALLARSDRDGLAGMRFRLAEGTQLDQLWRRAEGGWEIETARFARGAGLGYVREVGRYAVELSELLDAGRTVREAIEELAWSMGTEIETVAEDVLEILPDLIAEGFLVPRD
jgi:SAM-dependent methyltransferase